jgi:hypothetical protein
VRSRGGGICSSSRIGLVLAQRISTRSRMVEGGLLLTNGILILLFLIELSEEFPRPQRQPKVEEEGKYCEGVKGKVAEQTCEEGPSHAGSSD